MGLSNIQWTDYTFNPWIGCTMAKTISGKPIEECFLCYAKTLDDNRFSKTLGGASKENPISHWGNTAPRYRTSESNWKQPLAWNRAAEKEGTRRRVFCLSLGDWLDDKVPIEWLADLLKTIYSTPNLDWLLLTKRPQNWAKRIEAASDCEKPLWAPHTKPSAFPSRAEHWRRWSDGNPPANIWIGVSAGADQAAALAIPAKIHFLSCEPMLHELDTTHAAGFDWIIFGGESGSKARHLHTDWIRDGIVFCHEHGIAPFVKQLGANAVAAGRDQKYLIAMKDSHGGNMEEWHEDLRVREFPSETGLMTPRA